MTIQKINNYPLVSICIPTYNNARFLRECLDSIVNQTYQNKEIIIVDNASTDETKKIVKEYVEKYKIKYYRNEKNIGGEANFTRCIELAQGEFIAIYHSDDIYLPNMVEKQVKVFQDNSTLGAVFTSANFINSYGKIIGESKFPIELISEKVYYFPEIFLSILSNLNFLSCPSAMVRGKIYKEVIPFNEKMFGTSADLDMWFRILGRFPIAIINEKLMNRRIYNTHGSFSYGYLRTEQADFYRVMDYYLANKVNNMDISRNVLNKYEFLRSIDRIRCATNYLIQGKEKYAKRLLKKSFSFYIFLGAISSFKKTKFLIYWISGLGLLVLIYIGLGKYIGGKLHWLLYKWKRRFI